MVVKRKLSIASGLWKAKRILIELYIWPSRKYLLKNFVTRVLEMITQIVHQVLKKEKRTFFKHITIVSLTRKEIFSRSAAASLWNRRGDARSP